MNQIRRDGMAGWLTAGAIVGAAVLLATPSARAGDWSLHIGADGFGGSYTDAAYAEPVYEVAARRVWVEPEYVERRVRVRVPAIVQRREIPLYDRFGRVVDYRVVEDIVEPAYYSYRTKRVLVRDGYYSTVHAEPAYRGHRARAVGIGFDYHRHGGHHHHHRRLRRAVRVGLALALRR